MLIAINLLPGAKRKRGAKVGLALPDFKALLASVKDPWLVACVVAWVLVAGLGGPLYLKRRASVSALEPQLTAVRRDSVRYAGLVARKLAFEAKRDSLLHQIEVIRAIDRDRYVWPHILDAVAKALPDYTWLDDLQARTIEGDTSGTTALQLQGMTVDMQAFTRFMRNLEESPFLQGVSPVSTGLVSEQGRDVITFVVNVWYQVPDSTLLTMQPLGASLVQGVRSGADRRRR